VASCGWEPVDLADAMEERWAGTSEDRFESERELLKPMQVGDRRVTVPAGPRTEAAKKGRRSGARRQIGDARSDR